MLSFYIYIHVYFIFYVTREVTEQDLHANTYLKYPKIANIFGALAFQHVLKPHTLITFCMSLLKQTLLMHLITIVCAVRDLLLSRLVRPLNHNL